MKAPDAPDPTPMQPHEEAVKHVSDAHGLLENLRGRIKDHPELDEAIEKLENALSVLTMKTGGML